MYRIIDSRGTGKTSRLFLLAVEQEATIVCLNPTRMREKAYRYGFTKINFMSYDEYFNYLYNYPEGEWPANTPKKILIDEIEDFIRFNSLTKEINLIGYNLTLNS